MLTPARARLRSASRAGFVRLASSRVRCHRLQQHPSWPVSPLPQTRWQSTDAVAQALPNDPAPVNVPPRSIAVPSTARFNDIGVQLLSEHLYTQVFPNRDKPPPRELVALAEDHLRRHDLLGKNTDRNPPIAFDLPPIHAPDTGTLDEHFTRLGSEGAEPFLTQAKTFSALANSPPLPRKWVRRSGWTKYFTNPDRAPEPVAAPEEDLLCFDVEVMYKVSSYAVMACAMSPTAWYAWISPWLLGETESDKHLIPLGDPGKARTIVGHNIGYDRARILEEYDLKQTKNSFLDTMSLHVAVNGMCSQQRPTWMKHKKNSELREKIVKETDNAELAALLAGNGLREEDTELWIERSSVNSLRDVAKFHLDHVLDKSARDDFGQVDRAVVLERLDHLLDYCASDVVVTHKVYKKVFNNFLETCPHPVSFAALRHLSTVILPVDRSWDAYINNAEATYQKLSDAVQDRLLALTKKALKLKKNKKKWQKDPWLRQLDWSGQEIKMTKGTKKDPPRPVARQKMPGMPKWYKDLFPKTDGPINITVRTRIAPLLLRLAWDGYPLCWSDKYGWTFRVPAGDMNKYADTQLVRCDMSDEPVGTIRDDFDALYFKLPHKDGPASRCTNPLAKGYLSYFQGGILSSEYSYAKEALEMNASCSYWISARDRIRSQMVVYEKDKSPDSEKNINDERGLGYILPQVIPMGTITRRAVENTWLTASNAKTNRVGSELKAMVRSPPGYSFVGADVDSEELWIASVIGDSIFKLHGGNAIGFMTLEGTKSAGTDLHSRTASILGITRNNAKVFNYGRIYGAGLKFAATLLRQFNPSLSEAETTKTANKLYATTKGAKTNRKTLHNRPFWRGGTESFVFNKLEDFAEQERPRTPVLGAGITEALMSRYVSKGGYLTSRINWAIQSSGVDYLHLLIVGMDYLARRFNIDARLAITVHDEIRYLVKNEDKYRAAMALQVANLWTRAMFCEQVGIKDVPQSCAFFSAVDIDHVLRKEVDMDCITPSHPTALPHGESLDLQQLLDKGEEAYLDTAITPADGPIKLDEFSYVPRVPVMESLNAATSTGDTYFLKAQITAEDAELQKIVKEQRRDFEASEEGIAQRKAREAGRKAAMSSRPQLSWEEEEEEENGRQKKARKPRAPKPLFRKPRTDSPVQLPHMFKPFGGTKFAKTAPSPSLAGSDWKEWEFESMPESNYRRH